MTPTQEQQKRPDSNPFLKFDEPILLPSSPDMDYVRALVRGAGKPDVLRHITDEEIVNKLREDPLGEMVDSANDVLAQMRNFYQGDPMLLTLYQRLKGYDDWEWFVVENFRFLKDLDLIHDLKDIYERFKEQNLWGEIAPRIRLFAENGISAQTMHDDMLEGGDNMIHILGCVTELKEYGAHVAMTEIYKRLRDQSNWYFIVSFLQLFIENGVFTDLLAAYEDVVAHSSTPMDSWTLRQFIANGVPVDRILGDLMRAKNWDRAIQLISDLPMENSETVASDLYSKMKKAGAWGQIVMHINQFAVNRVVIDVQEVFHNLERKVGSVQAQHIRSLLDFGIPIGRIYDSVKLTGDWDGIMTNLSLITSSGIPIETVYKDFKESMHGVSLRYYARGFLLSGIDAKAVYQDLVATDHWHTILECLTLFQNRHVTVDIKRLYEVLKEQSEWRVLVEHVNDFIDTGVPISKEDVGSMYAEMNAVLDNVVLQGRYEVIGLFVKHGFVDPKAYGFDTKAVVAPLIRDKRYKAAKRVAKIMGTRVPRIKESKSAIKNPFMERRIEINKELLSMYFYEHVERVIKAIEAIPLYGNLLENYHRDVPNIERMKKRIDDGRADMFHLLRDHILFVVANRIDRSELNRGTLDVYNDYHALSESGDREKILEFLTRALGQFSYNYGITPAWLRITRAACNIWYADEPNMKYIDPLISMEHNGGYIFNRDARMNSGSDELTQKVFNFKNLEMKLDEFVKHAADIGVADGAQLEEFRTVLKQLRPICNRLSVSL